MRSIVFAILAFCMTGSFSFGNNIQVSSVDTFFSYPDTLGVQFDISWENSWRTSTGPSNHDAAWVFGKFRVNGGNWQHLTLAGAGHQMPSGATYSLPPDRKGAFLFRDQDGTGTNNWNGVRLAWDHLADGVSNEVSVEIRLFAIEMVYVPQGSFYVGDGETTPGETFGNFEAGTSGNPFQVISENALTLGGGGAGSLGNNNLLNHYAAPGCSGTGCLGDSGDDFDDVTSQTLPGGFPKGFNAFFCMKYEVTQQQIADMLNTLTVQQQAVMVDSSNFYPNMATARNNRYGITYSGGTWMTTEPYIPAIYADWIKTAAYADWSALRPMTELEFEKAARGPGTPLLREFPWGTATIDLTANLTTNNTGQANEGLATGYNASGSAGNCWINDFINHNMTSVARVGIFAANAGNTGRVTAGASYYGIMELGGNAWERTVTVGHAEGRKFTGAHGDGALDADGYADIATWPGSFATGRVDTNVGVGYRGGGMSWPTTNTPANARISSRRLASGYWNAVIEDDGFRLVRTAL